MNSQPRPIIYTDLDGTLLDRDSYSFEPAAQCLARLAALQVPVIPVTSKTFAEVSALRAQLGSITPFIVENGAATYIPRGYFAEQPEDTHPLEVDGEVFWVRSGDALVPSANQTLASIYREFSAHFDSLRGMTVEALVAATGLSTAAAQSAKARDYTDPILWRGDEPTRLRFIGALNAAGYQVAHGGRFLHVLEAGFDKGATLNWLTGVYCQLQKRSRYLTVACGDSDNDLPMLAQVDVAIFLGSSQPAVAGFPDGVDLRTHPDSGPVAWAMLVGQLLDELGLP